MDEIFHEGKFLIAPPTLKENNFSQSVIYLWKHDISGASGVIINKPLSSPTFKDICREGGVTPSNELSPKINFGGPVMSGYVGCLHTKDYCLKNTQGVYGPANFTFDKQIIEDIVNGRGPENYILTLGVASWDSGQLELEIAGDPPRDKKNSWLVLDFNDDIAWDTPLKDMWNGCVNLSIAQHSKDFTDKLFKSSIL